MEGGPSRVYGIREAMVLDEAGIIEQCRGGIQ